MSPLRLTALQLEVLRFVKAFQLDGLRDARLGERPCYWGHEPVPEVIVWAALFDIKGAARAKLFDNALPSLDTIQAALDYLAAVEYLKAQVCTTYPVGELVRPIDGAKIVSTYDDELSDYTIHCDGAFVHKHRIVDETVVVTEPMGDSNGQQVTVRGPYALCATEACGWVQPDGSRASEYIVNQRTGRGYSILKAGIQAVMDAAAATASASTTAPTRHKRQGPPRRFDPLDDERIYKDWQSHKSVASNATHAGFAKLKGMRPKQVKDALGRYRKRQAADRLAD